MRRAMLIVIVGSFALIAAGCSGDKTTSSSNSSKVVDRPVMMRDIGFEPGDIEVMRGTMMRLNIKNDGALMHDFTVDTMPMRGMKMTGGMQTGTPGAHGAMGSNAAMHMALAGKTSGTLEFEATEPGDYPFYCTEPGHREAGMHGVIHVK